MEAAGLSSTPPHWQFTRPCRLLLCQLIMRRVTRRFCHQSRPLHLLRRRTPEPPGRGGVYSPGRSLPGMPSFVCFLITRPCSLPDYVYFVRAYVPGKTVKAAALAAKGAHRPLKSSPSYICHTSARVTLSAVPVVLPAASTSAAADVGASATSIVREVLGAYCRRPCSRDTGVLA